MRNVKSIIAIGGVSAAMGVAALTGCSNLQSPIKNTAADGRSEGRVIDDNKITKSVEDRLKTEPVYKFESVEVKTYGGIVQLSGFVNEGEQKRRAEEIARSVGGVSQVINALALKPGNTLSPTGQTSGQRLAPAPGETTTHDNPNPNK